MEEMPMVVRIIVLAVFLFVIPTIAGGCFLRVGRSGEKAGGANLPFLWVSGQMVLWAGFQLITVPLIVMEKEFRYVELLFGAFTALLTCCGFWNLLLHRVRAGKLRVVADEGHQKDKRILFLWILFAGILLFQLIQAVRMTYGDGDDAYYVAVSSITESGGTMYKVLPYTGGSTGVDVRHGLAPFPIWIAFLSKVCGIKAVSVAHVAVPVMLISMTYAVFAVLGSCLCREKKELLPLFLIFSEILVIFGDYSFYSMENFMIARSRQGKAVFGSIVIPMLFLMLFLLFERMQEKQTCGFSFWLLLFSVMTAGCLCTTVGTFLECMLLGVAGVCGAVGYRRYRVLIPLALCCVPCLVYALLYMTK